LFQRPPQHEAARGVPRTTIESIIPPIAANPSGAAAPRDPHAAQTAMGSTK